MIASFDFYVIATASFCTMHLGNGNPLNYIWVMHREGCMDSFRLLPRWEGNLKLGLHKWMLLYELWREDYHSLWVPCFMCRNPWVQSLTFSVKDSQLAHYVKDLSSSNSGEPLPIRADNTDVGEPMD